jgi:hypothetical protein
MRWDREVHGMQGERKSVASSCPRWRDGTHEDILTVRHDDLRACSHTRGHTPGETND